MSFNCKRCHINFTTRQNLNYHLNNVSCKKIYKCVLCDKVFSTNSNINKHYKTVLHKYKEILKNNSSIQFVNSDNNNVNSSVINSNNINIIINNWASDDITNHISTKKIIAIIDRHKNMVTMVIQLLKLIYFNEKHPENYSMYIKNINTKDIHIKENDEWIVKSKEFSEDIIINILIFIRNEYELNKEKLSPERQKIFEKLESYTTDDSVFKECKRDVILTLFNNRKIILDLLSDDNS